LPCLPGGLLGPGSRLPAGGIVTPGSSLADRARQAP
jgi:hypothetical protein